MINALKFIENLRDNKIMRYNLTPATIQEGMIDLVNLTHGERAYKVSKRSSHGTILKEFNNLYIPYVDTTLLTFYFPVMYLKIDKNYHDFGIIHRDVRYIKSFCNSVTISTNSSLNSGNEVYYSLLTKKSREDFLQYILKYLSHNVNKDIVGVVRTFNANDYTITDLIHQKNIEWRRLRYNIPRHVQDKLVITQANVLDVDNLLYPHAYYKALFYCFFQDFLRHEEWLYKKDKNLEKPFTTLAKKFKDDAFLNLYRDIKEGKKINITESPLWT